MPNVIRTARAIWLVSLSYLVVGSVALWITGVTIGQSPLRSLLHAVWVFMGAWSTGGFAPQSYNTFYYHSLAYEMICAIIFVVGSFNFALHWSVWTGRRSELWKDIEMISFTATLTIAMIIATTGLMQLGVYTDTVALFRKMFYQLFQRPYHDRFQHDLFARVCAAVGAVGHDGSHSRHGDRGQRLFNRRRCSRAFAWASFSRRLFRKSAG